MHIFEPLVYVLCFLTSAVALVLLLKSYRQNRTPLLLWSALAFVALALNNLFLFVDIVLVPAVDLLALRDLSALAAVGLLLYGLIWKAE